MRSFIIGCSIVALALGILTLVAIYPYREKLIRSPLLVAVDSSEDKLMMSPPVSNVVEHPAVQRCGPGLATQDLAGQCRARPRPTMGALEALGKPATQSTPTRPSTEKRKQ